VSESTPPEPEAAPASGGGRVVFPPWLNYLLPALIIGVLGGAVYVPTVVAFGLSAESLNLGYAPRQPVDYSHALHAGELGMDCRYCHTTVEDAGFAAIPPTQTCMNCHSQIRNNSPKMERVLESYATGKPIEWIKVHDLADYAYFNHSVHVNKGVGCTTCHGRVDQMEIVYQHAPLSMGWCIDCHRQPEKYLRPVEEVTNMAWKPEDVGKTQMQIGLELKQKYNIHGEAYMTSCSLCHR